MVTPRSLNVSLLTPAADVITGADGIEIDLIFARAGNDIIYGYDPIADKNAPFNVDILVGDLFDSTPDEFNVSLQIASGNPLAILDANIPSVGKDRFILGDEFQPFYTSFDPLALVTSNAFGFNELAVVYDFSPDQDVIQLNGKRDDYRLVKVDGLPIEGVPGLFKGYALFSLQTGVPDLVSLIVQKPNVTLDLKEKYFEFVGKKPKGKPADKKIGQLGTTGLDFGYGAALDPSGNLFVTGSTTGSLQGANQGSSDVWVVKYDPSGNQVLGRQIGTSSGETPYNVVTDKDGNFYLAGSTGGSLVAGKQSPDGSDAWVAKYSSDGTLLWGRHVGTSVAGGFSSTGFGLQVDDQGNVYLSGLTIKDNPPPRFLDFNVQDDSWVTKFDSNGNQQWFTQIKDSAAPFPLSSAPFFDENYDLAVDKSGNSYAVGWTQGLTRESDPSRQLLKYDAWISKVNTSGQVEWVRQFGSTDEGLEVAWAADTDSQGNIYVSGWTSGKLGSRDKPFGSSEPNDVWLTKFTPDGTQLWAKQIGTKGDEGTFYSDLVIDSQDNVYLTGYTNDNLGTGKADASYNAFVAKFDANGNNQWIQKLGIKDKADYATRLTVNDAGQLFVTGFTEGFLGAPNSAGTEGAAVDAWLAQLSAKDGKLQKFTGNTGEVISIGTPSAVPAIDISNRLVTSDKLPSGDNQIKTTEGTNAGISVVDYGQIYNGFTPAFDPKAQNSIPKAVGKTIGDSFNNTSKVDYKGTDRNDIYVGSTVGDKLSGGKGDDVLYGRAGDDAIEGDDENDTLYGDAGDDNIKGGKGTDTLIGTDPNNTTAANEIDTLKGETNADVFVLGDENRLFYKGKGNADYALIDDFKSAESDKIQLKGKPGDYDLRVDVAGLPKGTGIFVGNDLIGIVKDVKGLNLADSSIFTYV